MNIRTSLGNFPQRFFLTKLFPLGLLKGHLLWLLRAAACAGLFGARITPTAPWTGPLQLDITQRFL
jgi:hypothetical protein